MAQPSVEGSGTRGRPWREGFLGLPGKIVLVVFAAALVTGVAVTLISTRSTEAFLREKIDERFPERLLSTARGLEHWYMQSEVDLAAFASSDIVVRGIADADPAGQEEARRYLHYVLDDVPRYGALLVLDAAGDVRVRAGRAIALDEARRQHLAAQPVAAASDFFRWNGELIQLLASPIDRSGERVGTLLGLISADSLQPLLVMGEGLDTGVGIYLVSDEGRVWMASEGAPARDRFGRALPAEGAPPRVESYVRPDGVKVVGTAMRVGRGWSLVIEQDYDLAFQPVVRAVRGVMATNLGIVLLFCAIAGLIARSIVRPIRDLSERARRIAAGEPDVDFPPLGGPDEIGVLSRVFHEMVEELRRKQGEVELANAELQCNNEVLEQLSFTDGLTRLPNHRYFQERLRLEVRRSERTGEPLGLLLLDLDDFKSLNDRHGHAAGDEVLRGVGALIDASVRETDLPARYGGEEFAVLASATDLPGVTALAEKLRTAIGSAAIPYSGGDGELVLSLTVSVGGSLYAGDARRLFADADRALYRAKGEGKDCVVIEAGAEAGDED